MKIALGMITYNEEAMLQALLPLYVSVFPGVVVVDSGSTDRTVKTLRNFTDNIFQAAWTNFSAARNIVIKEAEKRDFSHIFFLDADEAIFPADIAKVQRLLEDFEVLTFPRLEFIDREHINSIFYPDFQARCFKLRCGFHYRGVIHESVFHHESKQDVHIEGLAIKVPFVHIYHYGRLKTPYETQLHYENFCRTEKGEPRKNKVEGSLVTNFSKGPKVLYLNSHPLCS